MVRVNVCFNVLSQSAVKGVFFLSHDDDVA